MLNLLAGGILFLCSAYIGLQIKRHFKRRRDFFDDLIVFIDMLTDEISFLKSPLPKILERVAQERQGDLAEMLISYSELIQSGQDTGQQSLQNALNLSRLTTGEKDVVLTFLAGLGKTDAKTQLMALKNYRNKFEQNHKEAEKKFKSTGVLAYKLGILVGIAAMIMVA